jgi:hypothetical protein
MLHNRFANYVSRALETQRGAERREGRRGPLGSDRLVRLGWRLFEGFWHGPALREVS